MVQRPPQRLATATALGDRLVNQQIRMDLLCRCPVGGFETAIIVRTVAEWSILGGATATKSHHRLVRIGWKCVPVSVRDIHAAFDHHGAIIA